MIPRGGGPGLLSIKATGWTQWARQSPIDLLLTQRGQSGDGLRLWETKAGGYRLAAWMETPRWEGGVSWCLENSCVRKRLFTFLAIRMVEEHNDDGDVVVRLQVVYCVAHKSIRNELIGHAATTATTTAKKNMFRKRQKIKITAPVALLPIRLVFISRSFTAYKKTGPSYISYFRI